MKRFCAIGLMGLALLTFATPTLAGEFDQSGMYVVLGGLNNFENFPKDNPFENDATYGNSMGFQARFGARFLPYLAAEIQGDFISGFDVTVPTEDAGRIPLSLEGGNITGNIRAILPLGRFEPYAKVGVGGMWSNLVTGFYTGSVCTPSYWGWWCSPTRTRLADAGAFVAKFGGGVDVWITEDFALVFDAEYVLPTGELTGQQYVNFGWAAKFKF